VRKQAIPCIEEISLGELGMEDPLWKKKDRWYPGLVHRYPDRVLMVLRISARALPPTATRKREWHNGGWVRNDGRN